MSAETREGRENGPGFDPEAPVVLRHQVEVEVPPARAWGVLTRVDHWPRWTRAIRFAALRGALEPGTSLDWSADGMRITSVLVEVEPARRLGWTLRTLGARGYLRWTLEEMPCDRTRVHLEESWNGLVVRLFRRTLRRTLELSRIDILEGFGRACGSDRSP